MLVDAFLVDVTALGAPTLPSWIICCDSDVHVHIYISSAGCPQSYQSLLRLKGSEQENQLPPTTFVPVSLLTD